MATDSTHVRRLAIALLFLYAALEGIPRSDGFTCPGGFSKLPNGTACFKVFQPSCRSEYDFSFTDALGFCLAAGGNLASVHNASELAFINQLIDKAEQPYNFTYNGTTCLIENACNNHNDVEFNYWVGYLAQYNATQQLTGCNFTDGTPCDYPNPFNAVVNPPWAPGYPLYGPTDKTSIPYQVFPPSSISIPPRISSATNLPSTLPIGNPYDCAMILGSSAATNYKGRMVNVDCRMKHINEKAINQCKGDSEEILDPNVSQQQTNIVRRSAGSGRNARASNKWPSILANSKPDHGTFHDNPHGTSHDNSHGTSHGTGEPVCPQEQYPCLPLEGLNGFVCEYLCPPGWYYFADTGACYMPVAGPATGNQLIAACAAAGNAVGQTNAYPASIHSAAENTFVANLANSSLFANGQTGGANLLGVQVHWSGGLCGTAADVLNSVTNLDGSPVDYGNPGTGAYPTAGNGKFPWTQGLTSSAGRGQPDGCPPGTCVGQWINLFGVQSSNSATVSIHSEWDDLNCDTWVYALSVCKFIPT